MHTGWTSERHSARPICPTFTDRGVCLLQPWRTTLRRHLCLQQQTSSSWLRVMAGPREDGGVSQVQEQLERRAMQLAYHWAAREELPNQAHPVTPPNRTTLEPYQLARFQDAAFFDAVVEGRMPLTDLLQACAHPPTHHCLRDCGCDTVRASGAAAKAAAAA